MQTSTSRTLFSHLSIALFSLLTPLSVVWGASSDTFESATSPAPWVFYNGAEFPGATGTLTRGTGHTGMGAHLAFDTTAGGNYVSATWWLTSPVPTGAVQFWAKHPGGVRLQVRVTDGTGQTLQYSVNRPLEATDASQWYQQTVALIPTKEHWGGTNDGYLHGAITGVSILVQPTLVKVGALDFDDVKLLPTPSALIDPDAAPAVAAAVPNFTDSTGVEITHADATAAGLNNVQTLGFHRIRTEMFWADIETKAGVYNFAWYDQLVANLKARGLLAHFILCYGNPVYTGTDWFLPPRTPAAIQGFGNFAKAAAAHYAGQGVRFEVWNEPDIATFWSPPDAAAYSGLCQLATTQVHAGDPTAAVSTGGLAGIDLDFLEDMIDLDAVNNADAVAIHPYRLEIPEQLSGDLAETRTRLAAAFPANPPPVWSTEAGYSSAWYGDGSSAANNVLQAKYSTRQMLTGLGLGLPEQIFFALRNGGTNVWDTEQNFGIYMSAFQWKSLTPAIKTLLGQCKRRTFAGSMASPQSSTHIFKFKGMDTNDTLLVLWLEAAGTKQVITFPKLPQSVLDNWGNVLTPTADGKGNYTVPVSDSLVYVTFAPSVTTTPAVKK